jgi:glycosyltransferase involved in cell wall biosynthesis
MLVVHNVGGAGDRVRTLEAKPFRRFAFGSLLAYADEVAVRLGQERLLVTESLALPGDVSLYGQEQLEGIEVGETYDSIMCHLVLDHGGVVSDDFFTALRARFLAPGGSLLNAVKSNTKRDVARASPVELEAQAAPCVIKKSNNYNKPETVFELRTQAELDAWRAKHTSDEQHQYVTQKLLGYYRRQEAGLYQLERWVVLFDDLTVNYRYSDEFYIKTATALSYFVRDERCLSSDLVQLAASGFGWKGRSIDCAYDPDAEAWDARYALLRSFRAAFRLDYGELDVIRVGRGEFVVIDVNHTPGPAYKNVHFRELAVRFLAERLRLRPKPNLKPPRPVLTVEAPGRQSPVAPAPAHPRTNICLCMIVKNETAVLPRLFRSLKDYVDYYVIVDTGSTDDTIALIRREMSAYGIDGEVHERAWVNFGVNRQQALELAVAAGKAEWLLFIDADEELGVSDPKFYEKLEPGVSYDIEKHQAGMRYAVPHLVNIRSGRFKWEGPVHNYLVTLAGPQQRVLRKDVWIIYHSGEGAKSHGLTKEQKYLRDAKLLEEDLLQNPGNARSQFYLAQSYRDAGQYEKAYDAYKRRAGMDGWVEETFMAQLEAARMALRVGMPEDVIVREYLSAFNLRPTRVEPLHDLARYYRSKKEYGKAYVFARTGVELERPDDSLYVLQPVYDWRMLDELAVAAYWVGDYAASKEACETVLWRVEHGMQMPADDLGRVKENLAHALKKLPAA